MRRIYSVRNMFKLKQASKIINKIWKLKMIIDIKFVLVGSTEAFGLENRNKYPLFCSFYFYLFSFFSAGKASKSKFCFWLSEYKHKFLVLGFNYINFGIISLTQIV